jgi:hypothetical protein
MDCPGFSSVNTFIVRRRGISTYNLLVYNAVTSAGDIATLYNLN